MKYVLPTLLHAPLIHFFRYLEYVNVSFIQEDSVVGEERVEIEVYEKPLLTQNSRCRSWFLKLGVKLFWMSPTLDFHSEL